MTVEYGIGWGAIEKPLRWIPEVPKMEHFVLNVEVVGDIMPIAFGYLVGAILTQCIRVMTWGFVSVVLSRGEKEYCRCVVDSVNSTDTSIQTVQALYIYYASRSSDCMIGTGLFLTCGGRNIRIVQTTI